MMLYPFLVSLSLLYCPPHLPDFHIEPLFMSQVALLFRSKLSFPVHEFCDPEVSSFTPGLDAQIGNVD